MLKQVTQRIWQGEYDEVPSRSERALVTLILTRSDTEETECILIYQHHEGEDTQAFTRTGLITHLNFLIQQESWNYPGLLNLKADIEVLLKEFYI